MTSRRNGGVGGCDVSGAALVLYVSALVVLCTGPVEGGTEAELSQTLDETAAEKSCEPVNIRRPYIDDQLSTNVTAGVGSIAILYCRVLYNVDKQVSWIRTRDQHLITMGTFTYASKDKFQVVHKPGLLDWLLKIFYVQERDAGEYVCQVATTPPITHSIWLSVVVPKAVVLGGPEQYITVGSAINLTCLITYYPKPFILWYHGNKVLNYNQGRGSGVRVEETNKQTGESTVSSRLLIQAATTKDSGNYTCSLANDYNHTVAVYVINSRGGSSGGRRLNMEALSYWMFTFVAAVTIITY